MIRVFPRRTHFTPTDDLAFVGPPGLFRPPEQPVFISCVFTWDLPHCFDLYRAWSQHYKDVQVGGPALGDRGGEFVPGRFLKDGVTITSRGCVKSCPWCFVHGREGNIRELPIRPGWIVQDNNLLACSRDHIEGVFDMLRDQPHPARLAGGLDTSLLRPWHVDLLKSIRLKFAWFACDTPKDVSRLERAAGLLADISREKKRCYVLIGFGPETPGEAEDRLKTVYNLGYLPFAMIYRAPGASKLAAPEWRKLQKQWSRPAIYKALMKGKAPDDHGQGTLF